MAVRLLLSCFVVIGAVFITVSFFLARGMKREVPEDMKSKWGIISWLMLFFVPGYVAFVVILLISHAFPMEILTSLVFFAGAFFVFVVVNVFRLTISRIREHESRIKVINDDLIKNNSNLEQEVIRRNLAESAIININKVLESKIEERTSELTSVNKRLNNEIEDRKVIEEEIRRNQDVYVKEHAELNRVFSQVENAKKEWEMTMDCLGDIIVRTDADGKISRANKAVLAFTNNAYDAILDHDWEEVILNNDVEERAIYSGSTELYQKSTGKWFTLRSYPFYDADLNEAGKVITIHDFTENKKISTELEEAYRELKNTQSQMLQKEKMASIGQLAAGVAHEINNPMGFIGSNIGTLKKYMDKLADFITVQAEALESLTSPDVSERVMAARKKLKVDYVLEDIGQLVEESLDGADRVKKIVQNLKSFSRVDETEHKMSDINECIESTLNIVWNEIKYNSTVQKDYGEIPLTKCYPQQLNQVFMNLLVNSAHAIEKDGEIRIKTWNDDGSINISISDNGEGIPEDKLSRIFEPFFTTKPVGKGTGLGLSITYDIVKKHNGEVTVDSKIGQGTTFTITIPVVHEGEGDTVNVAEDSALTGQGI